MCQGCWVECGSPAIDNERVRNAAKLIADVYERNSVGGRLHIVVDDFNIEDSHLDFCERELGKPADDWSDEGSIAVQRECLRALRELTAGERASALGLHDGYWT